jgi:broad specificity phosphatase PhoE
MPTKGRLASTVPCSVVASLPAVTIDDAHKNMPLRLILVRHALPEIDPEVESVHWPLAPEGRLAATLLADDLLEYQPGAVVTSPLPKAFETGRILAENLFIPVTTHAGLVEHGRAGVGWLRSGDRASRIADAIARPDEVVFGDESAAAATRRFGAAIDSVLKDHPTETVIVVSHGTVLALFLASLDSAEYDAYELWGRLTMPAFAVLSRPTLAVERSF